MVLVPGTHFCPGDLAQREVSMVRAQSHFLLGALESHVRRAASKKMEGSMSECLTMSRPFWLCPLLHLSPAHELPSRSGDISPFSSTFCFQPNLSAAPSCSKHTSWFGLKGQLQQMCTCSLPVTPKSRESNGRTSRPQGRLPRLPPPASRSSTTTPTPEQCLQPRKDRR